MTAIYTCVGAILLLCVAVAITAFAIGWLMEKVNEYNSCAIYHSRREAIKSLGGDIARHGYWFSETPDVQSAIEELGKYIQIGGDVDMGRVRDRWKARTK